MFSMMIKPFDLIGFSLENMMQRLENMGEFFGEHDASKSPKRLGRLAAENGKFRGRQRLKTCPLVPSSPLEKLWQHRFRNTKTLMPPDIENPTPAPEVPTAPPVAGADPIHSPQPPAAPAPAAPPAGQLVAEGEVTDERALALARREQAANERERTHREKETAIAERERKIQEREAALVPVKPVKPKRKPNWSDPVFNADDESEN